MYNKSQYVHVWEIVRKLLVLSHGQAAVERGFSINKHCSMVNQSEDSLVARRFVRDHTNYAGGIENVIVTPGMVTDCKAASRKYNAHLEEKKRMAISKEKDSKKEKVQKKIDELKTKIETNRKMHNYYNNQIDLQEKFIREEDRFVVANPMVAMKKMMEFRNQIKLHDIELADLEAEVKALKTELKSA